MMNAQQKRITCHACGRKFSTQQSLLQHQQAVHGSVASRAPRGRRGGRRGRRFGGNVARSTPAMGTAQANTSIATPNQGIAVSGFERLGEINITKATVASWGVNAWMTPRLQAMSSAFQRIHYVRLVAEVVALGSSIGTGGYVIGFVADPSDSTPTIAQLQSQAGARTCKVWENCSVTLAVPNTLYYTSRDNEPRWYSPGRLVVLVDGSISSSGNLVINLHWSVRLSIPTATPPTILRDITVTRNLYVIPGKNLLGWKDATKWKSDVRQFLTTNPANGTWLRVPSFGIEYAEGTGDTGTIRINYLQFNGVDGTLACSNDGEKVTTKIWQSNVEAQVVVPSSTTLSVVDPHIPAPPAVSSFFQQSASNSNNDGPNISRSSPILSAQEATQEEICSNYLEILRKHSRLELKISNLESMISKLATDLMPLRVGSSQSSRSPSRSKDTTGSELDDKT